MRPQTAAYNSLASPLPLYLHVVIDVQLDLDLANDQLAVGDVFEHSDHRLPLEALDVDLGDSHNQLHRHCAAVIDAAVPATLQMRPHTHAKRARQARRGAHQRPSTP